MITSCRIVRPLLLAVILVCLVVTSTVFGAPPQPIDSTTGSGAIITTAAGTGKVGDSGDGGPVTQAQLDGPNGIAVDSAGGLFIADSSNNRIRKVSAIAVPPAVCPAVGADTKCGVILTITDNGSTISFTGQGPYDGSEDTLVGIVNNSHVAISALRLTSRLDIFGFDGEGIDTRGITSNTVDTTTYGGPNAFFTNIDPTHTSGSVNFIKPIAPGKAGYFSLEEAITVGSIAVPPPTPEFLCRWVSASRAPIWSGWQCGRINVLGSLDAYLPSTPGAEVDVYNAWGQRVNILYTDSNGQAGFTLSAGVYTVTATYGTNANVQASGVVTVTAGQTVTLMAGQTVTPTLVVGASLNVKVLQSTHGTPVSGASVKVSSASSDDVADGTTDSSGQAGFILSAGPYTVTATYGSNNNVQLYKPETLRAGEDVTATLRAASGTLGVRVLDAHGAPVSGANVTVYDARTAANVASEGTDSSGQAGFVLSAGPYTVTATYGTNNNVQVNKPVTLIAGQPVTPTLVVGSAALGVRVLDAHGAPVSGANVTVYDARTAANVASEGTDSSGQAGFVLSAGPYTVTATYGSNNNVQVNKPVTLIAGQPVTPTLVVASGTS
jgi:hypothetical protein